MLLLGSEYFVPLKNLFFSHFTEKNTPKKSLVSVSENHICFNLQPFNVLSPQPRPSHLSESMYNIVCEFAFFLLVNMLVKIIRFGGPLPPFKNDTTCLSNNI